MKQLQNNFTNPEQSKRLLEIGVPADSADCFYDKQFFGGLIVQTRMCSDWRKSHTLFSGVFKDVVTPCWSVGRLIEIIRICADTPPRTTVMFGSKDGDITEKLVHHLEDCRHWFDFSKLED